jgi:hypothetical protein
VQYRFVLAMPRIVLRTLRSVLPHFGHSITFPFLVVGKFLALGQTKREGLRIAFLLTFAGSLGCALLPRPQDFQGLKDILCSVRRDKSYLFLYFWDCWTAMEKIS